MRYAALLLVVVGLGACEMMPGQQAVAPVPTVAADRVDAFVVLVERLNCSVDPVDHEPVHTAGFTDTEITVIGQVLVAEGRAQLTDTGTLVLLTENCL